MGKTQKQLGDAEENQYQPEIPKNRIPDLRRVRHHSNPSLTDTGLSVTHSTVVVAPTTTAVDANRSDTLVAPEFCWEHVITGTALRYAFRPRFGFGHSNITRGRQYGSSPYDVMGESTRTALILLRRQFPGLTQTEWRFELPHSEPQSSSGKDDDFLIREYRN